MSSANSEYFNKHKKFRTDNKKLSAAFVAVAIIIAVIVFWCLKLVGITITGDAFCGLQEHTHSEECYEYTLVCGYGEADETTAAEKESAESTEALTQTVDETAESAEALAESEETTEETTTETTETTEATETTEQSHIHTDECYEKVLICTLTEHTHSEDCYPDYTADTETVDDWTATLEDVIITDSASENLLSVAKTQLEYTESERNFQYDEGGEKRGYTRYGEWYGNPYGSWNAMFVSFCLQYGNIENCEPLLSAGAETMYRQWETEGLVSSEADYEVGAGELIFFDTDKDGTVDSVSIVSEVSEEGITVITGDYENSVREVVLENMETVVAYGLTKELSVIEAAITPEEEITSKEAVTEENTEENAEETTEDTTSASLNEGPLFAVGPISDEEMNGANLLAEEDDGVSLLADEEYPTVKVDFNKVDKTGTKTYVIYALYNSNYYAINGNGSAVKISVDSNGVVTSDSMSEALYWTFTSNDSAYYIYNANTGRYLRPSSSGVTTTTKNASTVSGTTTFTVRNTNSTYYYAQIKSTSSFSTTTSSSSAVSFYAAEVNAIPTYNVWLDGTCGGIMSLHESPDERREVEGNSFILPAEWTSPSKYSYTLNGWYDIVNNIYYEPGATAEITADTVFYADWVATSYDVGVVTEDNASLIAPSLDTNSFIRTDMFDYSAIFNMQAVTYTGSISSTSHSETWSVVQNGNVGYNDDPTLGFIFRDWDSGGSDISYPGNLVRFNNNQGDQITSGIVEYVNNLSGKSLMNLLFDPTTQVIGKNYVGQANYLYQFMEEGSNNYDGEHNGYYYYDATLNAASYNQTAQRFYIYNYLERTSDSLKDSCDSNGIKTGDGGYSDFLPFNSPYANNHNNKNYVMYSDGAGQEADNYQYDAKATNQSSAIENVGTNYWFGMKSEIEFYLPDDTGTVDAYQNYGNISSHGQHMTFEFSGDDDMWVFIDEELVMDIGGLHGIMTGKIDFSTGTITTSTANDALGTGTAAPVSTTFMPPLTAGDHTLTVYYMERGGSQSNCAIYFNITPRYGMELVKQDSIDGEGLNGAVFGVYTDMECNEPATLWTSEAAYQSGAQSTNQFTAAGGKVSFWGVSAGKVYYLKELQAPAGYPVTDDIVRISMNALGNSICSADALRGEDRVHTDGFDIINNSADEAHQQIGITLTNQEYSKFKRNVAVRKSWNVDENTRIPGSVTVYLLANGKSTGRYAVLSEENNWSYLWIDLPMYDSNSEKILYSVYEEQAEDFFTDVKVSEDKTVNAWVQTDAFYDGGTFLIVNRADDMALTVNSSGNFDWVAKETAEDDKSAHWTVNADGMGFHVINENGYHIILDGTSKFVPETNGNRNLYYDSFGLAAKYNNTYYFMNSDFSAKTSSIMELELYINMDILIHEDDEENDEDDEEEDADLDGEVLATIFNVTNSYIEEEERTSFNVEKRWSDGAASHTSDSITVKLYADGVDTGRRLTLNNANGWKGTFEGLAYKDSDGNKIEYTVEEVAVNGYFAEYSEITEVEGGTNKIVTEIQSWEDATSLSDGEIYVFYNNNYALTHNGTTVSATSYNANNITDGQKWLVTVSDNSVYLCDPDNTSYYLYGTNNLSMSTSNKTALTYNKNYERLSYNYSNQTRHLRIRSGSLSTSTNNYTSFSLKKLNVEEHIEYEIIQPSYSITVNNIKAQYVLPETGGIGTLPFTIIGIALMAAPILYIIFRRKRERRSA